MTKEEKESITTKIEEFDKSLKSQEDTWSSIAVRDSLSALKKAMRLLGQENPSKKDMADLANDYASILRYEQKAQDYEQIRREFIEKFKHIYWVKVDEPKVEKAS